MEYWPLNLRLQQPRVTHGGRRPLTSPALGAAVAFCHLPTTLVWSSQTRDQIQAAIVTCVAAATTPDPLTHCARSGIEPTSWRCRDTTDPVAPQRDLLPTTVFAQHPHPTLKALSYANGPHPDDSCHSLHWIMPRLCLRPSYAHPVGEAILCWCLQGAVGLHWGLTASSYPAGLRLLSASVSLPFLVLF